MKTSEINALKHLRKLLVENDYYLLMNILNSKLHMNPWTLCPINKIERLPLKQQKLLKLFHLGVEVEEIDDIMDKSTVEVFLDMGLLERRGNAYIANKYTIYPYNGLFIIVEKRNQGKMGKLDQVWFGTDSIYIAKLLPFVRNKRVLDLGAGSGILGLILASRGAHVTSVELNSKAYKVIKWNAQLNDLEDNVEVFLGDLFEPVKNRKYHFVVSNPPFLPLPDTGDDKFLCGAAGEDGLDVLRRILNEIDYFLEASGKALFIAGGFGDNVKPYVFEELEELVKKTGLNINLILITQTKAIQELKRLKSELPEVENNLEVISKKIEGSNIDYYSFIISLSKSDAYKGQVKLLKCHNTLLDSFREMKEKY